VPLDVVIEFKRDVYQRALQELSRFLSLPAGGGHTERRHSARYLRQPRSQGNAAVAGKPAARQHETVVESQLMLAPDK
jgi:putative (di)nucleoside polyphosphate hydrolase